MITKKTGPEREALEPGARRGEVAQKRRKGCFRATSDAAHDQLLMFTLLIIANHHAKVKY